MRNVVILLVLTGLGLYSPIWSAKLIGVALPQGNVTLFFRCVLILVIIHVLTSIISYFYQYQMRILGGRVVYDLRRRMYNHLQRLSMGFYESRSSGEMRWGSSRAFRRSTSPARSLPRVKPSMSSLPIATLIG